MAVERKFQQAAARPSAPVAGWALTGVAVAAVWAGVIVSSLYAPDFVSGSQQEHLPLVGWLDWIWGIVATGFVALAAMQGIRAAVSSLAPWVTMAAGTVVVWAAVAFVSITAPVFVTGTDPTSIPLTALGVPILGVFLTWFICTFAKTLFERERA